MSKFRRQLMVASMSEPVPPTPPLPYDAEVEWLESTGTQYIQTGVTATSTLKCEIQFSVVSGFSFANTSFIFGTYVDANTRYSIALASTSAIRVPTSSGFTNVTCGTFGTTKHTISYQFGGIYYDGTRKSTQSGIVGTSNADIRLFGRNSNDSASKSAIGNLRIYGFKMTDGNNILRDFIPVRVNTTGYLYDRVSGQLFANAGTGDFTLGNDVN